MMKNSNITVVTEMYSADISISKVMFVLANNVIVPKIYDRIIYRNMLGSFLFLDSKNPSAC